MVEKEKRSTSWTWMIFLTIVLAAIFGTAAALYQPASPEPIPPKKLS
ncbi:MAG: hypothetical protein ACUVTD_05475 [Nitrososphaerales archaeon]